MSFKTLSSSLYKGFLDLLGSEDAATPKHARISDLLLTFKLLNTDRISSESKLTYAYLFFHRHDVTGFKIPILCRNLSMRPELIRRTLKELENKNHIKLITTLQSDDLSSLTYYYNIVDPAKYGMLELDNEQSPTSS